MEQDSDFTEFSLLQACKLWDTLLIIAPDEYRLIAYVRMQSATIYTKYMQAVYTVYSVLRSHTVA